MDRVHVFGPKSWTQSMMCDWCTTPFICLSFVSAVECHIVLHAGRRGLGTRLHFKTLVAKHSTFRLCSSILHEKSARPSIHFSILHEISATKSLQLCLSILLSHKVCLFSFLVWFYCSKQNIVEMYDFKINLSHGPRTWFSWIMLKL